MRTYLDCVPCFVRQAIDAVRLVGGDDEAAERVLRRRLAALAGMRMDRSPPFMGREVHRIIREDAGLKDPYVLANERSTQTALDVAPSIEHHSFAESAIVSSQTASGQTTS